MELMYASSPLFAAPSENAIDNGDDEPRIIHVPKEPQVTESFTSHYAYSPNDI